jgi:cysteine desulfurase
MRVALESAIQKNLSGAHPLEAMRDSLEAKLCASLPDVIIHCRELDRAPHTCQISFLGADRQAVVMALDQAGIAVATGTACESGASEVSRTLLAMGCEPALLDTSIRLSVGSLNTMGEMDLAAQRIAAKIRHLREVNRRRRPIEAARRGV